MLCTNAPPSVVQCYTNRRPFEAFNVFSDIANTTWSSHGDVLCSMACPFGDNYYTGAHGIETTLMSCQCVLDVNSALSNVD